MAARLGLILNEAAELQLKYFLRGRRLKLGLRSGCSAIDSLHQPDGPFHDLSDGGCHTGTSKIEAHQDRSRKSFKSMVPALSASRIHTTTYSYLSAG